MATKKVHIHHKTSAHHRHAHPAPHKPPAIGGKLDSSLYHFKAKKVKS